MQTPILITGASGFVGANLLRRLIQKMPAKNINILLRKNSNTWRINDLLKKVSVHFVDLLSQPQTDKVLEKLKPKTIFHLATHGAYPYQQNEKEIIDTNIICTFNLMQACFKVGFDSFINTGTSSEYGMNMQPMKEDDKLIPMTAYGTSKAWATLYCQYLALAQKAPIASLRLFGVYGFYEPQGRLIPNVILSLLKKEQAVLIAPDFVRDFVFVNDVINAYLMAAEQKISGIFNIGSGTQTSLKDIFYLIKNIIGIDIEPIYAKNADCSFDQNRRIADMTLAVKNLGWKPKTNLESGLQKTVDWFEDNISLYEK